MHVLGLYVGPLGQRTYLTDITCLIWPLRNVRVADLPKPVKIRGILCSRPYKPLILQLAGTTVHILKLSGNSDSLKYAEYGR